MTVIPFDKQARALARVPVLDMDAIHASQATAGAPEGPLTAYSRGFATGAKLAVLGMRVATLNFALLCGGMGMGVGMIGVLFAMSMAGRLD